MSFSGYWQQKILLFKLLLKLLLNYLLVKFLLRVLVEYWSLTVKIKTLRDPTCDVTCISSIIQDGGQFIAFSENISRIKQDVKNL